MINPLGGHDFLNCSEWCLVSEVKSQMKWPRELRKAGTGERVKKVGVFWPLRLSSCSSHVVSARLVIRNDRGEATLGWYGEGTKATNLTPQHF